MRKHIKFLFITICCSLQLHLVSAQSAEVTQLILNVEKLAQFKQILKDMKKGYDLVSKGYGTIRDISEGNFSLHRTFLSGLWLVNPEIARYRKVADIIRYQAEILSQSKAALKRYQSGSYFNTNELDYLSRVLGGLLDESLGNLDELVMVITANNMRMSDDERLRAIDRIFDDMQAKVVQLRRFTSKADKLGSARRNKIEELKKLEKMTGLRP
ncbi:TerB family tellurite resistance protein [Sphingobacterium sp. DR205]|uniref:TerB family tellurite resistance protein n=1 Tax=Sphingobacterium sp. DR205 TaxID=2713573 RepID=UPI0013E44C02|nr:TerB family tellurite resistance protein [Sphingobacterium sp. DR205]QIH33513.1 TerB family tellurite resistance protein [Sphingobacterium sp. DR205]